MPRNLESAFGLLKMLIPFEAAQLLRVEQGKKPQEIYRTGYSSNAAWALLHMFPEKYPPGFTQHASVDAPLPPTISTSAIRGEFTSSSLFRDYLATEGYAEGMTLELYTTAGPIGLAHFSSRIPRSFEGESRRAALAVSGLLGQLVAMIPDNNKSTWPYSTAPGLETKLLSDPQFVTHLDNFQQSPLAFVEHLWWLEDDLLSVGLVQPGHIDAKPASPDDISNLSRQELQVLSILCCGAADSEIAARLHLSIRTVQSHVSSLRRKLNAANRLEAVIIALGAGMYIPHPKWAPLGQIARGRLRYSPS